MILGGDYSKWDPPLDWTKHDWKFAFIKASEGTVEDVRFKEQWQMSKGYVYRGGYHFFRPLVPWKGAAEKFMQLMDREGLGEMPPVLDLEVTNGVGNDQICQTSLEWLRFVHRESGQRPIVYTSPGYADLVKLFRYMDFADYPLWEATYPWDLITATWTEAMRKAVLLDIILGTYRYTLPQATRPWQDAGRGVTFAQFTGKCPPEYVPGYPLGFKEAVDVNFYRAGLPEMIDQFDLPVLGEGEEPMGILYGWKKVTASAGLRIRNGAGGPQIGSLAYGDAVEVVLTGVEGWNKILQWYRGGVKQTLPAPQDNCYTAGSYLIATVLPEGATSTVETPTPPSTQKKLVKQVAHFDDGTTVETFPGG